jgi:hypothetical protein
MVSIESRACKVWRLQLPGGIHERQTPHPLPENATNQGSIPDRDHRILWRAHVTGIFIIHFPLTQKILLPAAQCNCAL